MVWNTNYATNKEKYLPLVDLAAIIKDDEAKDDNTKSVKMPKGYGLTKPMKVSDELAAIIRVEEASRSQCIKLLWDYLKENNLQCEENKQYFTPDMKMAKIFGKDVIRGCQMSKFLVSHLSPIDS